MDFIEVVLRNGFFRHLSEAPLLIYELSSSLSSLLFNTYLLQLFAWRLPICKSQNCFARSTFFFITNGGKKSQRLAFLVSKSVLRSFVFGLLFVIFRLFRPSSLYKWLHVYISLKTVHHSFRKLYWFLLISSSKTRFTSNWS